MNSLDFTGIIRNIVNEDPSRLSNFKLGTVSEINEKLKIKFDGEDSLSGKGYSYLQSYTPVLGDRVLLIKMSGTYVIVDRVITGAETNQIKYTKESDFKTHKAESVSFYKTVGRHLGTVGTQVIEGFPFIPELLLIDAISTGTKKISFGKSFKDDQDYVIYKIQDLSWSRQNGEAIRIYEDSNRITTGKITINNNGTISIIWEFAAAAGATGNAAIHITAIGHRRGL